MTLTLTIQDQPNGITLPDLTPRLTRAIMASNLHGDESLQLSAKLSMTSTFERYDRAGTPHAIITDGAATPFQGRIEDAAAHGDGLDMTAFGYQRALSDARYTALWSSTHVGDWQAVGGNDIASFVPERYVLDTNNRLYLAPQKNGTFSNALFGGLWYRVPDQSSRSIVGVSFDFTLSAGVTWRAILQSRNPGTTNQWILAGAAGVTPGSVNIAFAAQTQLIFLLFYNAAAAVYVGETGAESLEITNLRIVTSTTNRIDVTNTAGWVAGANVTIPVTSTARMYAGQRLFFDFGAASESCIVASVTDSTHVVVSSISVGTAAAGFHIRAHVVYADEIVRDLVSVTSTLNSTQLLSDTSQVTSPALDLFDEVYEDAIPSAILDHLISTGDNQTPPAAWEWGVTGLRQLYYRAAGTVSQTWYVDVTALELQRSLNLLYNSAYAVYQDASGRTLRGAVSTDAASVAQRGITRTQAVDVSTTSLTQANVQRDAAVDDAADPPPRFGLTFAAVYNSVGGRVPLWLPRAGDTIVIRNLPPTLSVAIDQIRSFRIARTTCDLIARTLTIEPLVPLPSVQALLANDARRST